MGLVGDGLRCLSCECQICNLCSKSVEYVLVRAQDAYRTCKKEIEIEGSATYSRRESVWVPVGVIGHLCFLVQGIYLILRSSSVLGCGRVNLRSVECGCS